ncbi:tRNA lysidine(34) synthetase TilS [Candidatus Desulfovibrio trichonymphae]|uniref:tRNA(Ile)-lysidine synthase n=1 Tax=Candidatus Desulfovibrio trichonymphae TaxID=1725232 RepID=A0A1J1E206_9BACT|nr:tRNA lysidine(34) synthetase TilS [Candidatus Desulfovibrio trichonymphae]BAV91907.1 tRNA(Ile)-lysidine synthetase [Candidatus Desulfovibrio trichonymphae]GHU97732.1 tRNA(Ile)-lysidine synthase [Deltaproteobacteria bacterium]
MNFSLDIHDLSPNSARLCLAVEQFIHGQLGFDRASRLLLAVSGGADSSALALILRILAPRLGLELSAMTVNHGLQPDAACTAAAAAAFCARLGIPCTTRTADVAGMAAREHLGLEEAGRHLRYAILAEERRAAEADFIVLGHHCADLTEDILMRLTRGSGWPAMAGMRARDDSRHLLRPLLCCKPHALRSILREYRFVWREDISNTDMRFKRNRMRHAVIPLLYKENPSLDSTMADLWRLAQQDRDYWDKTLAEITARHSWKKDPQGLCLPKEMLQGLHPAVRLRLYHKAVSSLIDGTNGTCHGQARAGTLTALDTALQAGRGETRFQLPGGIEASIHKGSVYFCLPGKLVRHNTMS